MKLYNKNQKTFVLSKHFCVCMCVCVYVYVCGVCCVCVCGVCFENLVGPKNKAQKPEQKSENYFWSHGLLKHSIQMQSISRALQVGQHFKRTYKSRKDQPWIHPWKEQRKTKRFDT